MSTWISDFMNTKFGRMLLGLIKLALAGLLISLVSQFGSMSISINVGGNTYDISAIIQIIVAFFPVLLLISALRDLDIHL